MYTLEEEINRRCTFAIISHPDAGKTTLTEKLLLYGGAIQTAGAVKGSFSGKNIFDAGSQCPDGFVSLVMSIVII